MPTQLPISKSGAQMTISYLISQYPAVSHTFIHREIVALRELGFKLAIASINPPDRAPASLPSDERAEMARAFYVKPAGWKAALLAQVQALLTTPLGYLRGLLFAIRLSTHSMPGSLRCLFYFVEAVMVGLWMKKNGSTHLHVHFAGPGATVGLILSVTFPFTFSMTVHGPDEFYDVSRLFLKEKVERAKFICAIGSYARSQLMRLVTSEHWQKIAVSPLGVDVDEFAAVSSDPAKLHLDLICVGRLVPAKGQGVLLQAARELISRGRDIRLCLIGDGPDRDALESLALAPEFENRVVFTGSVSSAQVRDYLGRADIFVLPSFAEGIPVALMEAMSMRIPCVSTCICGIPELIENGVSGMLVAPSDVEALTDALDQLVTSASLRTTIGNNARRRILANYQLRPNVRRLADIFASRIPSEQRAWPPLVPAANPEPESAPFV
jgi:colanic acid/amylovoran biosynthesis glycosyltransferase